MTNILLKIHYNKITENYTCETSDLLVEHFSNFAKKCKKSEDDFIFLYRGSVINYKNPATNAKIKISDTIFGNSQTKQFNIFAVLITSPPSSEGEKKETLTEQNEINSETGSNYKEGETSFTDMPEIRRKINKQYYLDVVCPRCDTTAIIDKVQEKNGLLLNVLNCGNFHYLKNIHYDAFDDFVFGQENDKNKEENDIKKILNLTDKYKCDCCSTNKLMLTPPYDDIYICSCGSQYCSSCLSVHKMEYKDHTFQINIDDKNYLCLEHGQKFVAYCLDCNANICEKCRAYHKDPNHEIIEFNTIRVNKDVVNKYNDDVDKQKETLIDFTETIRCLFEDILGTIENYINSYIMIERGLIRRFKLGFHNYQLLRNLKNKELFKIDIIQEMENLNKEYDKFRENNKENKNINDLFNTLLKKIYNPINDSKQVAEHKLEPKSSGGNKKSATINYIMSNTSNQRNIKLFDPAFVKNNIDKLQMVIKADYNKKGENNQIIQVTGEKKYEGDLIAFYRNVGGVEFKKMQIELAEKDNKHVVDMSYMFNNCKYFSDANFSKWDLNGIYSMEAMFQLCKGIQLNSVKSIINKGADENLSNIRAMFCKCTNLKFEADVDKWFFKLNNDTKLRNMSMLFSGCKKMESINLNSWKNYKFNYLEDISYMFNRCTILDSVDNFKRFNTSKVKNMCGLFNECKSLKTLSNFTINTSSAENTSIMFQGCENLTKIDNGGNYDAKLVKDASGMFANCSKLSTIKNIIYYTSDKLENVTALFKNCKALSVPPDYIQKWVWVNVKKEKEMFAGCDKFTSAPKWFMNMKFYDGINLDNLLKDCKLENRDKLKSDWEKNLIKKSEIK